MSAGPRPSSAWNAPSKNFCADFPLSRPTAPEAPKPRATSASKAGAASSWALPVMHHLSQCGLRAGRLFGVFVRTRGARTRPARPRVQAGAEHCRSSPVQLHRVRGGELLRRGALYQRGGARVRDITLELQPLHTPGLDRARPQCLFRPCRPELLPRQRQRLSSGESGTARNAVAHPVCNRGRPPGLSLSKMALTSTSVAVTLRGLAIEASGKEMMPVLKSHDHRDVIISWFAVV